MFGKRKKKADDFAGNVGFCVAFKKGDIYTRLSALVWGLNNLRNRQIIKGILLLLLETAFIVFMVRFGAGAIGDMMTLGTVEQTEEYNEALGIYEYRAGDDSMLCLLYGVITIFVILAAVLLVGVSVRSAYLVQQRKEQGRHIPTFTEELRSLKHEKLHNLLLFLPVTGIVCFTIIPLVFMILIAFTSYDRNHQPPGNLFDWVGLSNFREIFSFGGKLAGTFWPVLGWTLTWAVLATVTTYILGIILALIINRRGTKWKPFWRFLFVMSIAVPQFVSLLTMRTIFNTNGPANIILRELGIIGATGAVPFFTDPTLAKVTIILINIWIGVPYTLLTMTGILQNIPEDLYEAARVDGANTSVMFFKITLPYMLFVTTPNLITQFTGNINNFNVIYLLSGGGPDSLNYYYAGKTDLLVTWLYKLTITNKDYNLGAVIGIFVFVILATLSLLTYRRTSSYKDEEAFQ